MSDLNTNRFSTCDYDDTRSSAARYGCGGWWKYDSRCYVALNAVYYENGDRADYRGINWSGWPGGDYKINATQMMIRPTG